jgi:hypothetical protein
LVETVFDLEGIESPEEAILGELKTFRLEALNELRHIWKNFPKQGLIHSRSLSKLEKLEVCDCKNLRYIFSSSVAKLLVNLREMTVRSCEMMEQVIMIEEDDIEKNMDAIAFPKLHRLVFHSVENLTSFYLGNRALEFPSVEELLLHHCPSMDKFCSNSVVSTPKLNSVDLGYSVVWIGYLNTTIPHIQESFDNEDGN